MPETLYPSRNPPIPDFERGRWYVTKSGVRFSIVGDFDQIKGESLCVAQVRLGDGTIDTLAFDARAVRSGEVPWYERLWTWICTPFRRVRIADVLQWRDPPS